MHPVLFQLGPITIYTYGVLAAAGFLLGLWWAYRQAPRAGLDPRVIWNLGVYGILVALVCSKLWYIFSMWDYFIANPRAIFSLETFQSAGTFYGGVVGGILWVIFYARLHKLPLLGVFDLCAAPVALGHSIGRVGCFVAGCCYGKPTSLPWGVTFTNPIAARISGTPLNISLHPTQLYEAGAEFVNFHPARLARHAAALFRPVARRLFHPVWMRAWVDRISARRSRAHADVPRFGFADAARQRRP